MPAINFSPFCFLPTITSVVGGLPASQPVKTKVKNKKTDFVKKQRAMRQKRREVLATSDVSYATKMRHVERKWKLYLLCVDAEKHVDMDGNVSISKKTSEKLTNAFQSIPPAFIKR
jgi:hypothetical protein